MVSIKKNLLSFCMKGNKNRTLAREDWSQELYTFFFLKIEDITAFLYADGNVSRAYENLMVYEGKVEFLKLKTWISKTL